MFTNFSKMYGAVEELRKIDGFQVVMLKNKFQNPTPLGYRDMNLRVSITLPKSGRKHLCEVQINHANVIEAKAVAHEQYEGVREMLPEICRKAAQATGGDIDHKEVQKFVAKR